MNKFVDYGKRSITLPEGCKDLIDVLRLDKPTSGPGAPEPGSLADVEAHVARQLQAAAEASILVILWGDAVNIIHVIRTKGTLELFACMVAGGPTEAAVREVFEQAGIPLAREPLKTLAAPTQLFGWQLPGTAGAAAGLICALLRNGYGVAEAARLYFYYVEESA
jgi:8-oxo-dGTP pyrophosphatase MutT (NUDIX family)